MGGFFWGAVFAVAALLGFIMLTLVAWQQPSQKLVGNLYNAILAALIVLTLVFSGGMYSFAAAWILFPVVTAFLVVNKFSGMLWTFGMAALGCSVWWLHEHGVSFPIAYRQQSHSVYFGLSLVTTPLFFGAVGFVVASMRESVDRALQQERNNTQHKIDAAVQQVLQEQEVVRRKDEQIQDILDKQAEYLKQEIEEQTATLRKVSEQLRSQNEELQRLHAEKDELLGIIAHDVKNPLASIMLTATLLKKRWQLLTLQDVIQHLTIIETRSYHIENILKRLLKVAAVDSGQFYMNEMELLNISSIMTEIVHEYSNRAAMKSITIDIHPFAPETYIFAVRSIIIEILENLLSNAIKYTPQGSNVNVLIIMSQSSAQHQIKTDGILIIEDMIINGHAHNNYVRIEVHDQGQGIAKEELSRLFTKFGRLSAHPTGGEDSTGLGLYIVKKLVETQQGAVWYEPNPTGKGANFIVEFPIAKLEDTNNNYRPSISRETL